MRGREVVIVGSGDIGFIMARRFVLEGAKVKGVIEIDTKTRGLMRNVVQCIEDFNIPIYFNHRVARIYGQDRLEGIDVVKVDTNLNEISGTKFTIKCDTALISVGLIPENELIEMAGITDTDSINIPGLFVCGNAFKVYDLVDSVSQDSIKTGQRAARYLKG